MDLLKLLRISINLLIVKTIAFIQSKKVKMVKIWLAVEQAISTNVY